MAFIDKSAIWAVKKEASYGAGATFNLSTDLVEFIDPQMDGDIERIDREVLKNSLVKSQSLLGKETSSGTLPVEVSTTDGSGALNGDVLYESAMGVKIAAVASEVTTTSTASTVTVASGAAYTVGGALKLGDGSTFEYVVITGISGNILSFSPDVSFADDTITSCEGLLSYTLATPQTDTTSFAVQEYLEDSSSSIAYTYNGCVATSMNLEFPIANIIKSTFNITGAGFSVATVPDESRVCTDNTPHIAKSMTFTYGGTSYDIADLAINVENATQAIEAITTEGITNMLVTGKDTVGGSFNLEYEGIDLFNTYKAGTAGILNVVATASNGKKFGAYAPKVVLNSVSKSIENSIYQDNVEFECLSSENCIDGVEDALTIWFE